MVTPTGRDTSRPAATDGDTDYTLSLDAVSEHYAHAGHPRTIRTLQRYCASGHLDCQKVATTLGDKYLVTSQSVARHIAQIEELRTLDMVAASRVVSRQDAAPVAGQESRASHEQPSTTDGDSPRQSATREGESSRFVAQLEKRIEEKDEVIVMLRGELAQRNDDLVRRNERERETNILIRGLQNLVLQLQPARTRNVDVFQDDPVMKSDAGVDNSRPINEEAGV